MWGSFGSSLLISPSETFEAPSETLTIRWSFELVSVCTRYHSPLFTTFSHSFISITFYSIALCHTTLSSQTISSHSKSSKNHVVNSSYLSSKNNVRLPLNLRNSQPSLKPTKQCLLSLLTNNLNNNQRGYQSDILSLSQYNERYSHQILHRSMHWCIPCITRIMWYYT